MVEMILSRILNGLEGRRIWCQLETVRCGGGVENVRT